MLALLAALPWSLIFNYQEQSASTLLLAFTAALSLSLAAVPLAQPLRLLDGLLAAVLPVIDAFVLSLTWRSMDASGLHFHLHLQLSQTNDPEATTFRKLNPARSFLATVFSILTKSSSISAILISPLIILSGELRDMSNNCYVLDTPRLWHRIAAGGVLLGVSLISLLLTASMVAPFTLIFLQTPVCAIAFVVICYSRLTPQSWINVCLCLISAMAMAFQRSDGSSMPQSGRSRDWCGLARKVFLAVVLYGASHQASYTMQEYLATGAVSLPSFATQRADSKASLNGSLIEVSAEPSLNSHLMHHNFLGSRPPADTFARIDHIMENCTNDVGVSGVDDVVRCLSYLSTFQGDYFVTPHNGQAPQTSKGPQRDQGQSRTGDGGMITDQGDKLRPTSSKSACSGPFTLFHTYWTGPATWRFELFLKAYLYTQNLSCSQLWIWLDTDIDPLAFDKMLYHDPLFQRFNALVDNDYIVLQKWKLPDRIPLPRGSGAIDTASLYRPRKTDQHGEVVVADGVIQDASGMLWLVPDPIHKTVSTPTQVSDFVRFLVLHLHGGVYLDLDMMLLRDLRPLLLPNRSTGNAVQPAWAEQWVELCSPSDYNTAVLSLPANSSLTSYLLRGGLRMGMNFHPRIIGRMLWKDGRNDELTMLHTSVFDPLVTNLRRKGTNVCTVPCHKNFESPFMGVVDEPLNEWSNYNGSVAEDGVGTMGQNGAAGTNRTLEHFFRGAFAYHIHNQVSLQ